MFLNPHESIGTDWPVPSREGMRVEHRQQVPPHTHLEIRLDGGFHRSVVSMVCVVSKVSHDLMWCDTTKWDAIWYDAIWYAGIWCDAIRYEICLLRVWEVTPDMMRCCVMRYDMVWHYVIWCDRQNTVSTSVARFSWYMPHLLSCVSTTAGCLLHTGAWGTRLGWLQRNELAPRHSQKKKNQFEENLW